MIRFIFYIFVFYMVMKLLRIFVDPLFEKKDALANKDIPPVKNEAKPKVGEYIDFEEVR